MEPQNEPDEGNGENKHNGWLNSVVNDWNATVRLVVILLAVSILGVLVVREVVNSLDAGKSVELKSQDGGFSIILRRADGLQALVPVPAPAGWVNSHIQVPPKATVELEASGRVSLAIHHIVEAAQKDKTPETQWLGPSGDLEPPGGINAERRTRRICTKAPMGCVLAHLRHPRQPAPDIRYSRDKYCPRPDNIHPLHGGKATIPNPTNSYRELWFCVNDIVLDKDCERLYKGEEPQDDGSNCDYSEDRRKYACAQDTWREIVTKNYWHIWFDDNIGSFFVKVRVKN